MMSQLPKLLAIVLLLPGVSFAQRGHGGGRGSARGPIQTTATTEEDTVNFLSILLFLNDMQQQQLRTAFDAAVKTAAPITTQLNTNKDAIFNAARSGKSDDDQVKSLAAQRGSLTSQLAILQAQTFQKLWAMLTSDQKGQVGSSVYDEIGELLSSTPEPVPTPSADRVPRK